MTKNLLYCLQICSSIAYIRLKVAAFSPLVPAVDIEDLHASLTVESILRGSQSFPKCLWSVLANYISIGITNRLPNLGLDGARAGIPPHSDIGEVGHVVVAAHSVPVLKILFLDTGVGSEWRLIQRYVMNPDVACNAVEADLPDQFDRVSGSSLGWQNRPSPNYSVEV